MLAQPLTATADLMFLGYIFLFFFTRLPGLSFGGGGGGGGGQEKRGSTICRNRSYLKVMGSNPELG